MIPEYYKWFQYQHRKIQETARSDKLSIWSVSISMQDNKLQVCMSH